MQQPVKSMQPVAVVRRAWLNHRRHHRQTGRLTIPDIIVVTTVATIVATMAAMIAAPVSATTKPWWHLLGLSKLQSCASTDRERVMMSHGRLVAGHGRATMSRRRVMADHGRATTGPELPRATMSRGLK